MDFGLIFRTVRHLKTTQVVYQVLNRVHKPRYRQYSAPKHEALTLLTPPIPRYKSLDGDVFSFLNLDHKFTDWNYTEHGTLWTYNLNYFDYLGQESRVESLEAKTEGQEVIDATNTLDSRLLTLDRSLDSRPLTNDATAGCYWIDRFISERPSITWGMDPYPIALRGINWIKFFCRYPETATKEREDSLYSQYKLLEKKLEYHLLGNHLLEDAYSLFIGSLYFEDKALFKKASKLLKDQLEEQTLMDGAHYEQSPIYHCILLDRLLDCINFGQGARGESQESRVKGEVEVLTAIAQRMLGHLESVVWSDKTIPLLNDSANGIAPAAEQIFDYAKRLGLEWVAIPMKECGYRKMSNARMEAIVDVGNITATYQPGHTHADTLNYELRINGKPFVVDTGISTYNKNERRQYERSSAAHNCVCALLNGKMLDSSEVWGGFRVGRRANVRVSRESHESISAEHDGYGKLCARTFTVTESSFTIEDSFSGEAVSLIHLAPGVRVESQEARDRSQVSSVKSQEGNGCLIKTNMGNILIEGADRVDIVDEKATTEYNRFEPIKVLKIYFKNHLKYTIQ